MLPTLTLAPTISDLDAAPRRAISQLSDAGFRAAQLSASQPGLRPRELDQSGRRDLLATLRRREVSASGIDAWIPPEHDWSHCRSSVPRPRLWHWVAAFKAANVLSTVKAQRSGTLTPDPGTACSVCCCWGSGLPQVLLPCCAPLRAPPVSFYVWVGFLGGWMGKLFALGTPGVRNASVCSCLGSRPCFAKA